ncbi:MAG: hypothetical protein O9340_15920 [Cyclobacteriaceae bacterium]|jgi:hypothetical protein|nr:hypothetical protein [Cyclobacteriaceae bacterium]
MWKFYLLIFFSAAGFQSVAQIKFENGYFITDDNERLECLIKNYDWKSNPKEIEVKLKDSEEIKIISGHTIKEFGISGVSKFIRAEVEIDYSVKDLDKISKVRDPEFTIKVLLLKVIIEGKASLYSYSEKNLTRYFFKLNDNSIRQLIYKPYLSYANNEVAYNTTFRQQLKLELDCPAFTIRDFKSVRYDRSSLLKMFELYNQYHKEQIVNYNELQKRNFLNLNIRSGLTINKLITNNDYTKNIEYSFNESFTFRFGLEAEFLLPFNNGKWSFIVEPNYHSNNFLRKVPNNNYIGGEVNLDVRYNAWELPLGFRHYFFIGKNSSVFVNAQYNFHLFGETMANLYRADGSTIEKFDIKVSRNLIFGVGYRYKSKISVEYRYHTTKDLKFGFAGSFANYTSNNLIFGYTIF